MTYLPTKPSAGGATGATAGALADTDTVQVVQSGVTKTVTLAVLDAYILSSAGSAGSTATTGSTGSTPTTSPAGTYVRSVGPTIVDAGGNVMAINSSGNVVTNGTPEDGLNGHATTANVVAMFWDGTSFYQQNNLGNWYKRASVTATYAGPVSLPESAEATDITTVGPGIVDAAGNVYQISSDGYVVANGTKENGANGTRNSGGVVEIYYHAPQVNGVRWLYQRAGTDWYGSPNLATGYTGPLSNPKTTAQTPAATGTTPAAPAAGPGPTASSTFITVNAGAPTANVLAAQLFGVAMASDVDFTPWANTTLQNAAKVTAGFGLPGMYARINSNDSSLNSDGSANLTYVDRVIAAMPQIIDMATGEFTYNVGYANNNVWNTNPTQIAAGAKAIAQRFVNAGVKPQGYEIFNESNPDGGSSVKVPTAAYTPCFTAAADAILSVDPNAKIVGPNDSFMATDRIGGLASAAGTRPIEFSYHIYQVNSTIGDADAFSQAISRATSDASRLRATSGAGSIPARLSEYNMDGSPPGDERQLTIKGAVWNALLLHSAFTADPLHTHGAIWDWLGDGFYSQIIDPNNNPKGLTPYSVVPSGYMLKTARQYMGGKRVPITTAPTGNLKLLATVNGSRVSLWAINYDTGASFSGTVALNQWPVNATGNGTLTLSQLNQSNATPAVSNIAVTNGVTASITLPPLSVSVLTSAA